MAAPLARTRYPGVFCRGSRYVVPYRHHGKQHKPSFRTLAEARAFKARLQGGETRVPATRLTVEAYAALWLPTYQGRTSAGFSERARVNYKSTLDRHAIPYFGRWKMSDVRRSDVRDYIAHMLAKGLAPSSVKKGLVPLSAMFATAVDDDELPTNPFAGARVNPRREAHADEDDDPAKALTMAELDVLMGHVREDYAVLFRLLADTGLRISEAIGLNVGDVEFGARPMLHVRRQCYRGEITRLKTSNSRRDVPLSSDLSRSLWTVCHRRRPDEPLFVTRQRGEAGGGRLSDRNLRRRVLDPAAQAAGVPWIGFHTFRHTCASRLLHGGKNIAQVSRWLGHADPAFTLRTYVHLMDEGLGDADFLDARAVSSRVGLRADLRDPVANVDANAFDVTRPEIPAVHDHIAGSLQ